MKNKTCTRALAYFLAALLLYAAIYKLFTFERFSTQLQTASYITGYSTLIVPSIPVLELIVAALLARPVTRIAGLFSSFFLVNIYTIYLLAMLIKGHQMPCECGELWSGLTLAQHLLFNLCMIVLSAVAIILAGRSGYRAGELYN